MRHPFHLLDCKVYVNKLGNNSNETELEWTFGYNRSHKVCGLLESLLPPGRILEWQLSDADRMR